MIICFCHKQFLFWTRCHTIGSYNLLLHICRTCCTWFDVFQTTSQQHKHDCSISKPFAFKIPPCPDMHHTHCILAQPQSMKFLQQPSSKTLTLHKSDVPRRSVGWKQPPSMYMYVHAYAWSVETHWQNKFLHTRIYTYNETKIAPSAHAIGYACEKLYITYIMYDF